MAGPGLCYNHRLLQFLKIYSWHARTSFLQPFSKTSSELLKAIVLLCSLHALPGSIPFKQGVGNIICLLCAREVLQGDCKVTDFPPSFLIQKSFYIILFKDDNDKIGSIVLFHSSVTAHVSQIWISEIYVHFCHSKKGKRMKSSISPRSEFSNLLFQYKLDIKIPLRTWVEFKSLWCEPCLYSLKGISEQILWRRKLRMVYHLAWQQSSCLPA